MTRAELSLAPGVDRLHGDRGGRDGRRPPGSRG